MSDLAKTNKSILIMRGPSQFPFLKKVFVNDETIVMTLFIDKKEVKVEIAVQFCSSNIESPLTIIGYIKNSATANKVKDFLQIDKDYTHDSNEWNVYFSALYDIKEGKGELFPFLLNSTTTEIYHSGVDFDPADHPYNDDITIAWPNPLKIILEHHKAFAIKRAVAEALANAKKPESRPNDESVCNRVSALKIIIANCDQGDELAKKIIFQLLNQTCNLTKPVGLLIPSNCVAFGNSVLNKVKIILEHVCWETYIAPYWIRVDFEKGSLTIAESITNPNSPIEFQTLDMILLNEISKIVW